MASEVPLGSNDPVTPAPAVTAHFQGDNLVIQPSASRSGRRLSGHFQTPTPPPLAPTPPQQQPPPPAPIIIQGLRGNNAQPPQAPRVGGIINLSHQQWDVFTGGSNLAINNVCHFTTQRRPSKFESVTAFEALLDKGMEQKLASPDAKSSEVTLTIWFTNLATHLVRLGLDTIFRVVNAAGTNEVYIAQEWGHFRDAQLQNWANRLQNGVNGANVCPYDLKNLDYSGRFLLASLTKSYKYTVLEELGPSPHGLAVFGYIVKTRLIKALTRQRDLITKLSKLQLSDQEGENVRKFNVKLRDCCREIEQTGPPPRDLAFMVSCTYVSSQVPFFANKLLDVQLELEDDPTLYTWTQVLEIALNHYLAMDTFWTPAGNSLGSNKELKAEVNSLRQSINSLKLKAQGDGKSSKSKKEKICFDCGEKNQVKGHDGCKHKGEKLFLPERFKKKINNSSKPAKTSSTNTASKPSDEEWPANDEKVKDGKEYVLCRKCFDRFKKKHGRWYSKDAPNAHKTDQHRGKPIDQSGQNMVQLSSPVPQCMVTSSVTTSTDPDLLNICNMAGITMEELINKVSGAKTSPSTKNSGSPSVAETSCQRELDVPQAPLELAIGLLDDYSDCSELQEQEEDTDVEIGSHWFKDCQNLRRPVPTCGLCHQHHPGQECPLLNKSSTNHVSILGGMPDLSVEVEPPIPENASPVDTNNCSDDIAEESNVNCSVEPDSSQLILDLPYSNWYCINNCIFPNTITHLSLILMFYISCFIPSFNRLHLGLSIGILIYQLCTLTNGRRLMKMYKLMSMPLKNFLENGPQTTSSFCYPKEYMILSCVMMLGSFAHMYCNPKYLVISMTVILLNLGLLSNRGRSVCHSTYSKLKKYLSFKYSLSPKQCAKTARSVTRKKATPLMKSPTSRFARLAVLSTIAKVHSLPTISMGRDWKLRKTLHKHVNFMGHLDVHHLPVPKLAPLQEYLMNEFQEKHTILEGAFPYIVDTGCACSCSPAKEDFETLDKLKTPITLKGVTGDQQCTHGGMLKLQCINEKGDVVTLRTPAYHNPHQTVRLFSPQCHFQMMHQKRGSMLLSWAKTCLNMPDIGVLPVHIDQTSFMPVLTCFHNVDKAMKYLANPCVTDEINPMLSAKSKLLLKLHYKMGHLGFKHLKFLLRAFKLFGSAGVMAADPSTDIPKCSGCIEGGMEKIPIKGNIHTKAPHRQGCLKREQLVPGQRIFSDQYVSSLPGKHFNGRGHLNSTRGFKGGTIFCDAASGFMSIHHQQSFTGHETIQSMLAFERESAEIGVFIHGYNTDNGVYTAKTLIDKLHSNNQLLRLSGVGAHHQNGVAENAIKNISRKARIYMFHAALRWPQKFDKSLWPLAMSHAVHLHNHTPRQHDGLAPVEIWTRSKSTHSQLTNAHPWGVPAYVLNPRLQDGFKIPRFDPRSMQGIYVGPSPLHASTVGLILNPRTNRISPQFHVIYDDYFETVSYGSDLPKHKWEDLVLENFEKIDLEHDPNGSQYDNGWEKPVTKDSGEHFSDPPISYPQKPYAEQREPFLPESSSQREKAPPMMSDKPGLPNKAPVVFEQDPPPPDPPPDPDPEPVTKSPEKSEPAPVRRSSRDRRPVERFQFDKAHGYFAIKKFLKTMVTLCSVLPSDSSSFNANYAYTMAVDPSFGIITDTNVLEPDFLMRNPNLFKAGKKDADTPGIMEALSGPYRDDFLQGMQKEIQELEAHGTWTIMKRADIPQERQKDGTLATPKILAGTWAFRIKRFPDGLMRKIKARFCVRGDLQTDVDVFDTYAPVASWKSIRMLTILALQNKWDIKQIDFSNAFVQAPMTRDVYISLPQLFTDYKGIPASELCMKLNKSLYGLREAPKLWSDYLAKALLKAGFTQSAEDPGVYYGRGMALAVYVDDVLLFGPSAQEMLTVIQELQVDGFDLKIEKTATDQAYDFLGVRIEQFTDKDGVPFNKMTQHGLIKKFLETVDMVNCNPKDSPCNVQPLGTDKNGKRHFENWDYASAVGMLMYLAGNAHPEIQFAVHQCARFCHAPRHSHAIAVKRIAHYLKGVLDKKEGLLFKVNPAQKLDLFVDADFAGLWGYEDDQDPVCVRSRTGYVMTLGDCPLHWCSKLQTEIACSTLEAEYIALAQAMRELIPVRRIFVEMLREFKLIGDNEVPVKSTVFEDNNGCIATCTAPKMSPRTKHIAVKYHFVRNFFTPDAPADTPYILEKVHTDLQKADIFTKGLSPPKFLELRKLLCGY